MRFKRVKFELSYIVPDIPGAVEEVYDILDQDIRLARSDLGAYTKITTLRRKDLWDKVEPWLCIQCANCEDQISVAEMCGDPENPLCSACADEKEESDE